MTQEDVVSYCLEMVAQGRKTVEECVAEFPHSPQLAAELKTGLRLRALQRLALAPDRVRRIEYRVRQKARTLQWPRLARWRWPKWQLSLSLRWGVAVALVIGLSLASSGAVAAASNILPRHPLYWVKRTSEAVQLALTPSTEQASLHLAFAQHRLAELEGLIEDGPTANLIEAALTDLAAETEAALQSIEQAPPDQQAALIQTAFNVTLHQQDVLAQVQAKAPPEARAGLARALQASQNDHGMVDGRLNQRLTPTTSASWTPTTPAPTLELSPTPTDPAGAGIGQEPPLTPSGSSELTETVTPPLTATRKIGPVVPSPHATSADPARTPK